MFKKKKRLALPALGEWLPDRALSMEGVEVGLCTLGNDLQCVSSISALHGVLRRSFGSGVLAQLECIRNVAVASLSREGRRRNTVVTSISGVYSL